MKIQSQRAVIIITSWSVALLSITAAAIQTARLGSVEAAYEEKSRDTTQTHEKPIGIESTAEEFLSVHMEEITGIYEEGSIPVPDGSEEISGKLYVLPVCSTYAGMKTYEDYRCITDDTSYQYELQLMAYTDKDGFRKIDNRYLVAIGTHFEAECGTLFDIILENDEKIPAIVGDIKADIHTDVWNVYSIGKCATEFIIDSDVMSKELLSIGDISFYCEEWKAKVKSLYTYDKNILDDNTASLDFDLSNDL